MANTYLTKTLGTPTNNKIWTFSAWVKRAKVADGQYPNIFCANSLRDCIRFHDSDKIQIFFNEVSSGNLFTNRLFRDVNAWYHIVVAVDTTQATASNRVKLYVNGVQETSFATETYPAQNYTNFINSAIEHRIGKDISYSEYYKGSMSHIHFIDGTAYDASAFGETDATTGEWKIKTSPSVTYGTNGFFILKDGNSVTDQSGNSNNWTVASGTLTNTEDCPSNVFNVFSDTTSKKAYVSEGGLKVSETGTSWNVGVGGTIGASSGKYYWEFYKTASSDNFITGIIPSNEFHRLAESTASAVYNNANAIQIGASTSWWYKIGTGSSTTISGYGHGSGSKSSGLFQLALDLTNKKMWIGKDGTWYNSGNPATGANPLWTGSTVFPDDIYVPYWQGYGTVSGRFNFGGGSFGSDAVASAGTNASNIGIFEYDVPTGYTALSTKGLNE